MIKLLKQLPHESGNDKTDKQTCAPGEDLDKPGRHIFWVINEKFNFNSNTDRLYSQWLNSVIYWLINHCMH